MRSWLAKHWKRGLFRLVRLILLIILLVPMGLCAMFTRDMHQPIPNPEILIHQRVEKVAINSQDGVALSGWYISGDQEKPAVLLVHGVGANRLQFIDQANFLIGRGHGVLLFDFRNHGESGGSHTTYGFEEKFDVLAMSKELRRRQPKSPIVWWGLSMGAASILLAAPMEKDLAGVIAESPFDTLYDTFDHHTDLFFGLPMFPIGYLTLAYIGITYGFDTDTVSPIAGVRKSGQIPMLFVAGREDRRMPPKLVMQIAEAHPNGARFFLGEGRHAEIFQRSGDSYKQAVAAFLEGLSAKN